MIYRLNNGKEIDTAKDLTFEERNFVQKMMIYAHLKFSPEKFRGMWQKEGNPVWQGPRTLASPGPAVKILLDMESKLQKD